MESKNQVFNETVNTLFQGMDGFVSTKTVVGDAIHIGETIIVPLVNVTFGKIELYIILFTSLNNIFPFKSSTLRLIIFSPSTKLISLWYNLFASNFVSLSLIYTFEFESVL